MFSHSSMERCFGLFLRYLLGSSHFHLSSCLVDMDFATQEWVTLEARDNVMLVGKRCQRFECRVI